MSERRYLDIENGDTVRGTFLGGTSRQIRMDANGDIRTFDIGDVKTLNFPMAISRRHRPLHLRRRRLLLIPIGIAGVTTVITTAATRWWA